MNRLLPVLFFIVTGCDLIAPFSSSTSAIAVHNDSAHPDTIGDASLRADGSRRDAGRDSGSGGTDSKVVNDSKVVLDASVTDSQVACSGTNTVSLFPSEDLMVNNDPGYSSTAIDTNYGTAANVLAHLYSGVFLRFDVSAIPAQATITSDKLSATVSQEPVSPVDLWLSEVATANLEWTEANSTWRYKIPMTSTKWAGDLIPALFIEKGVDYNNTAEDTVNISALGRFDWNVRAQLITQWRNGSLPNTGLIFHNYSGFQTTLRSREATNPADRPVLKITYQCP